MKKIFLGTISILILACFLIFFKKSIYSPNYLDSKNEVFKQISEKKEHEAIKIIKKINNNNLKIQSLYIDNVSIKLKQKIQISISGNMAFERNKNFKMNIFSNFGKELDIGSNSNQFWFWSKRMNPNGLFYADHKDLNKTLLKTPLNPNWLLESLTIMELNIENIEIGKFNNYLIILQKRKGISNETVTIATLIDPINERIIGNYLYDLNGKMLASSEILNFHENNFPKTIFITWYEEGITMEWKLNDPKINIKINPILWDLPNINPKINMANPIEKPKTSNTYRYRL